MTEVVFFCLPNTPSSLPIHATVPALAALVIHELKGYRNVPSFHRVHWYSDAQRSTYNHFTLRVYAHMIRLTRLFQELAGHHDALDLVRPFIDLGDLGIAHHSLDREVPGVSGAAE
jgi:hypothetical protein